MIISLDCESTGIDLAHGAMPFLVTSWDGENPIDFWEWSVNPYTRKPDIPPSDLVDIAELIDAADIIYLHNAKFDVRALATIGINLPWPKVRDTLCASHLLSSNGGHRLDQLCVEHLGENIEKFEDHVQAVTQACRAIVKRDFPNWKIANEGVPGMPSVKSSSKRDEDKPWKNDMWLPRALAKQLGEANLSKFRLQDQSTPNANWLDACSRYANADSQYTWLLGVEMERKIRERGYWDIYERNRLHLPRIACEMEAYGMTAIGDYTAAKILEYEEHVAEAEDALVSIAAEYGHKLELAAGAALNDNMRDFFYGATSQTCPRCGLVKRVKHWNGEKAVKEPCPKCAKSTKKRPGMRHEMVITHRENLALPVVESKKTGNASLDKDAMLDYIQQLDDGPALDFIELLSDKRLYDTALGFMHAYRRYWVPVEGAPGYYRIHTSLNPFGTDHLRWACNSPNMQNVSGETKQLSNRGCFGPLPGREWWRMDFKSIENRIPAYESGEPKMIEVFERPHDPPYWGSMYLLTASVLYPEEYWPVAEIEGRFREQYPRLYKGSKFFVLAKQYGCGRKKGDLLSKVHNSFDKVDSEFPLMAKLQGKYLSMAEKLGYVETLPDRTVDPIKGYPVMASRTEEGRVLSTTPFNYHVSGTACWVKNAALIRCSAQCKEWRAEGFDAHIALEVHDEILFDFPRGVNMEQNLWRAMILKGLMEQSGENLIPRIPTPVSVEYITKSWGDGVAV